MYSGFKIQVTKLSLGWCHVSRVCPTLDVVPAVAFALLPRVVRHVEDGDPRKRHRQALGLGFFREDVVYYRAEDFLQFVHEG